MQEKHPYHWEKDFCYSKGIHQSVLQLRIFNEVRLQVSGINKNNVIGFRLVCVFIIMEYVPQIQDRRMVPRR